jgi:hypothetical protein
LSRKSIDSPPNSDAFFGESHCVRCFFLFPPDKEFPAAPKKFPAPLHRELSRNALESFAFSGRISIAGRNAGNCLLFSLRPRNPADCCHADLTRDG